MASIRIFMFSYDSLLCIEWSTGIEGRVLPLWRTVLRRNLDESIKSRQSRGWWLILSVCIRSSISVQATRPLSILKNWTRSSCLLRYTEILTFSFRKFHCCSLEPNSSALLLGKSSSLIRSFNSSCVIQWNLLNWRSTVKSLTATSLTGTVPVWPLSKHHYSSSGSAALTHVSLPKELFYALSHTSCIMTTRAKNWILRPYLVSAHWVEKE